MRRFGNMPRKRPYYNAVFHFPNAPPEKRNLGGQNHRGRAEMVLCIILGRTTRLGLKTLRPPTTMKRTQKTKPVKVAIIGLDTSHSVAMPQLMQDPKTKAAFRVPSLKATRCLLSDSWPATSGSICIRSIRRTLFFAKKELFPLIGAEAR